MRVEACLKDFYTFLLTVNSILLLDFSINNIVIIIFNNSIININYDDDYILVAFGEVTCRLLLSNLSVKEQWVFQEKEKRTLVQTVYCLPNRPQCGTCQKRKKWHSEFHASHQHLIGHALLLSLKSKC